MQISIDKTEGLERNLSVTIPAQEVNAKVSKKLAEYGKQVRIKGFRPGKVPKNILVQRYGKSARGEVLEALINSTIQDAVKENDLAIAETPEITDIKDLDDGGYSFVAKLELMPQVPAIEFENVKVKTQSAKIKDGDIDKMIKKLQKQKQKWKESKGKIANGDLITIEYIATDEKDFIYPNEGKEKMGILLGESGIPQELIDALIDMKKDDSDSLKIEFPKKFNVKEMADKKLKFSFEITDHKKGKLPKVDEDFVKEFGIESGDIEELRTEIKENLERELANTISTQNKDAALKALRDEIKDMKISDKMIARESAALAHHAMDQAKQMGQQNPEHPDHKQFEEDAKIRIINSLIISDIAQKEKLQVDFTKVREKVIEISQTFENPTQIVEYYYKTPEAMSSIENTVLESQVVDWIISKVDLKEKKVDFDKIINTAA